MSDAQDKRHSGRHRLGKALFIIWNTGMLVLAMLASQSYQSCMAQDTYWKVCIDLTGPILFLMVTVDGVGLLTAAIVHRRRSRG